ncbi:MAG TPA: 23S rRNA (pseudouridine(1915)-N(3))-methyltransferase RlmH [Candidatus Eremiobacteraceae bacterium]|nr:23S rRNA (pseudouridine(1915)-N(3))-methyltransferase RlmH [Candidatus Eremiobacteraceae bacterium]
MHLAVIAVDKLREPFVRAGCDLYRKRLGRYYDVSVREVKPSSGRAALAHEARALLGHVGDADALWAFDRQGARVDSIGLARLLARVERSGVRRLAIAIGGADGLHASVLERAADVVSLSDLTFLHEIARLLVFEQLYRAVKINRGEPYHR